MSGYAAAETLYSSSTETESVDARSDAASTRTSQYGQPAKVRRESPAVQQQKERAAYTFDSMKAALIAFGIEKAKEFLGEALPGFDRHLADAERRNRMRESEDLSSGYREASGYSEEGNRIYMPEQSGYPSGSSGYESGSTYRAGSQPSDLP
jgi:hypothetical protein